MASEIASPKMARVSNRCFKLGFLVYPMIKFPNSVPILAPLPNTPIVTAPEPINLAAIKGGISAFLPITYWGAFNRVLFLMGFPFLSGFYSKDMIVEEAGGQCIYGGVYWLGFSVYPIYWGYIRFIRYYWQEEGYGRGQGIVHVAQIKEGTWLTLFPLVCLSTILGLGPLISGLVVLSFVTMFGKSLPLVFCCGQGVHG